MSHKVKIPSRRVFCSNLKNIDLVPRGEELHF